MGKIYIIGLGPGDINLLTVKAFQKIKIRSNDNKYIRWIFRKIKVWTV